MKKEKKSYDDSWLYIFLLATITILLESLKTYTFNIKEINLTYSLLFLPLIYLIANYINKKYNYQKALIGITVSALAFVAFSWIMSFALGKELQLSNISGEFLGYVVSQLINLIIYTFLLNNTKQPTILIFLTYLFSLIVYYLLYTLIYLNMIVTDSFWTGYFITLGIQFIICIPLAIIDKKIPRGIGKIKKTKKEQVIEEIEEVEEVDEEILKKSKIKPKKKQNNKNKEKEEIEII